MISVASKECISKDQPGMLSLYEDPHLAFKVGILLDESRAFTTEHLNEIKPHIDAQLKKKIERAMELPSHWRSRWLDIEWFIKKYERDGNVEPVLSSTGQALISARCKALLIIFRSE